MDLDPPCFVVGSLSISLTEFYFLYSGYGNGDGRRDLFSSTDHYVKRLKTMDPHRLSPGFGRSGWIEPRPSIGSTPGARTGGITDIEIHFLQIKFTAIGVYLEPEIVSHLQPWKVPVEKFLRIVVIKENKGSQYGVQLESAVRDRLAAIDKYEEEEEEALEKVVEFFQSKYFKKDSIITFSFPATPGPAEASIYP
ncbi:hypothetical protein NE237_002701 [Protea cynaroides]|uniref:Chalcone-flavonone isomerase family protein n=1 Tax=Protea cynaroides TaxID=273540 RepID=A0A9Q0KFK4_9MAGN|nr:hypothetical protein NE237_002701 [Protea cynaroides]